MFAWTTGFVQTYMTVVLKCGSHFIQEPEDNFSFFFTYLVIILIPVMLTAMISRLNASISYFEQLEIIPIYQSSIILLNVLVGGVMFDEFKYLSWAEFGWFSLGAALCILGTLVVLYKYSLSKQIKTSQLRTTSDINPKKDALLLDKTLN